MEAAIYSLIIIAFILMISLIHKNIEETNKKYNAEKEKQPIEQLKSSFYDKFWVHFKSKNYIDLLRDIEKLKKELVNKEVLNNLTSKECWIKYNNYDIIKRLEIYNHFTEYFNAYKKIYEDKDTFIERCTECAEKIENLLNIVNELYIIGINPEELSYCLKNDLERTNLINSFKSHRSTFNLSNLNLTNSINNNLDLFLNSCYTETINLNAIYSALYQLFEEIPNPEKELFINNKNNKTELYILVYNSIQ